MSYYRDKNKEAMVRDDAEIISLLNRLLDWELGYEPEELNVFIRVSRRLHETLIKIKEELESEDDND